MKHGRLVIPVGHLLSRWQQPGNGAIGTDNIRDGWDTHYASASRRGQPQGLTSGLPYLVPIRAPGMQARPSLMSCHPPGELKTRLLYETREVLIHRTRQCKSTACVANNTRKAFGKVSLEGLIL